MESDLLVCEDLMLLLLDDRSGASGPRAHRAAVLGGALLSDLALLGMVEVRPRTGVQFSATVHIHDTRPLADPLLHHGLSRLVATKARSPRALVGLLGAGLESVVGERLRNRGLVRREETTWLWMFPRTVWPADDPSHKARVCELIRRALVAGRASDPHTAALIALLVAADRVDPFLAHPKIPAREFRRRARGIAAGHWPADAVQQVRASSSGDGGAASAGGGDC